MKIYLRAEYDPQNDPEHEQDSLDKVRRGLFGLRGAIWSRSHDGGLEITLP